MEEPLTSKTDQLTILVVDDDRLVLDVVSTILKAGDYNVLAAQSAEDALRQSQGYEPEIQLLLSDFEMPEMNGAELATAITSQRPTTKVLLMSGFTGGMLVLNEGWHFLPKPFIASQLRGLVMGLIDPGRSSRFTA